jgi:hypothetical protein
MSPDTFSDTRNLTENPNPPKKQYQTWEETAEARY